MKSLELKIPPPILCLLVSFIMWLSSFLFPNQVDLSLKAQLGILLGLLGLGLIVFAVVSFKKVKTTISPTQPQNSTVLVDSGIFRLSRNPMYLGMAIILTGWAIYLGNFLCVLGPIFFIIYITRFQIMPEEKILREKWGETFIRYTKQTKRWF